ncbi:MAG TPA: alanine racemase [Steroidobacteraceae bacterium]|nr:alanine racemase [Steroidobacteraceae bacterium]
MTPLVSATVDTVALAHNLGVVRRCAPRSRVMAVIKANGYGHGLISVARALATADALAVARVDEGLAVRAAGIDQRTVLLEGVFDADQLAASARAGFELVVHVPEQIELLRSAPGGTRFRVWLKLDSGMNRLGFKGAQFDAALAALRALPAVVQPVNLFTHLSSADDPERPATEAQLARFAAATGALPGERSIANSAGLLGFPAAQADWVRPGLLLYGVSPFEGSIGADYGLKPAMTLHCHVIAVKDLAVGETVGYGGAWVAARPTRLAVAAVGYGDGYPRSLSSGSPVLVNGERAPLAGRVSMDMIGIDVTDLKVPVRLGDRVTLWGEGLPVEEVAVWANTVPYELLCGISQRVAVTLR